MLIILRSKDCLVKRYLTEKKPYLANPKLPGLHGKYTFGTATQSKDFGLESNEQP